MEALCNECGEVIKFTKSCYVGSIGDYDNFMVNHPKGEKRLITIKGVMHKNKRVSTVAGMLMYRNRQKTKKRDWIKK